MVVSQLGKTIGSEHRAGIVAVDLPRKFPFSNHLGARLCKIGMKLSWVEAEEQASSQLSHGRRES